MSYVLFFSFKDPNCKRLAEGIINGGVGPMFKFANIDDPNIARGRPQHITKIPSIYIPDSNKTFVGEDTFKFVQALIQKRQGGQPQVQPQQRQQPQQRPQAHDSNPMMRQNMYNQQPEQKKTYQITNQPIDYESVMPRISGGPSGTGESAGKTKEGFGNIMNGGMKDGEIQGFMPSEMCNGTECYSFLDNSDIHGGFYYLDDAKNANGASNASSSQKSNALQYNPNVDSQQRQQSDLPRGLQAMNAKVSKNGGVDMSRELEKYTNQRTNDVPMAFNGGGGGNFSSF